MSKIALSLQDVSQSFFQGGEKISILRQASLSIEKGQMTALIGPSGAGKTTLLNVAGLLEDPQSGTVEINGQAISKMRAGKKHVFGATILVLSFKHIGYCQNFLLQKI